MTASSECFKKQVKSNTYTAFNIFIEGIIAFLPMIVSFVYLFTFPAVNVFNETTNRLGLVLFGCIAFVIINAFYAYIIAIPLLKCYFGEDL